MASPSNLLGYCGQCLNNVQHRRAVRARWARWLDRATGGVARYLGIGPWYCISCGHRALLFPPYRAGCGVYDPRSGGEQAAPPPLVERVGNVFDGPESLIGRLPATSEYSEKFRASIVERLLECRATFSALRRELDLSELELQAWVADYVARGMSRGEAEPSSARTIDIEVRPR